MVSEYREAVDEAVSAAAILKTEVAADLDPDQGGIGWWNGHIGWKESALLGEYLLSSCEGVGTSLVQASLATQQYKQTEYAQNHELVRRWGALAEAHRPQEEFIGALEALGKKGREREDLLQTWSQHGLLSLSQALDRLAAVVAIVAGIKVDVLKSVDWGAVEKLADRALKNGAHAGLRQGTFAEVGTPGRELQNSLLQLVKAWPEHGPPDWLPWLTKSRNTATHRAPRFRLYLMLAGRQGRSEGYVRPFYRQPDWADTEVMARSSQDGIAGMLLPQAPTDVMTGLRDSTVDLTTSILRQAMELWKRRREDPSLIIQPGSMWPDLDARSALEFPGYGKPAKTIAREIAMRPDQTRRLQAARLMDDRVHLWRN